MKSLKYSKKINEEAKAFALLMESYSAKVNKEYMKNVLSLLSEIAKGENLDYDTLKKKYIKKDVSEESEENKEIIDSDKLLDPIIYDSKTYYVDTNNDNIVYDGDSNIVGKYKNKIIIFSKNNESNKLKVL